jgi:hypothetical protein
MQKFSKYFVFDPKVPAELAVIGLVVAKKSHIVEWLFC